MSSAGLTLGRRRWFRASNFNIAGSRAVRKLSHGCPVFCHAGFACKRGATNAKQLLRCIGSAGLGAIGTYEVAQIIPRA
jgi:hypothetical protein